MYCKGMRQGQELKRCLIINGGQPFKKRETKIIEKYFKDVDFIEKNISEKISPGEPYDLIVLNWTLQGLADWQCSQLLKGLRRSLCL